MINDMLSISYQINVTYYVNVYIIIIKKRGKKKDIGIPKTKRNLKLLLQVSKSSTMFWSLKNKRIHLTYN